jgi:cardiolipin synthase (CMP-forming)
VRSSFLIHIPNTLTILRICLAFYFPFAPPEYRLMLVGISLATEYFDGALSRWFKWSSQLGGLLDPIADKLFIFSVVFTIFFESNLTWWQLLLIGARDTIVFFGALYILFVEKNWKIFFNVHPRILGKVATVLQFILITDYLYFKMFHGWILFPTIIVSVISGADYLYLLFKRNFYRSE